MSKSVTKQYTKWSDEETAKIIQLTSMYTGTVINWEKVSTHFYNRSPQQCKSFHNNKVRQFGLQNLITQNGSLEALAKKSIIYLVSANVNEHECMIKHLCVANIIDRVKAHIAKAFQSDSLFEFDLNILKLIESIITVYKANVNTFLKRVAQFGCVKFEESVLRAEQVQQLVGFMNSFDYNSLLEIVNVLILVKSQ
ncbi:Myb-like_DNA-binding domain-containing protein [Hexamita inflata]|uniref:Myb-like DNA-binding domain-containing protein n=1 Tax=Hexamita inflata TaxID=28002 RepID=A0AA86PL74_9EUKA|nr:Myb-like DNA-binding domain-containing protein [Hexamita inflata]